MKALTISLALLLTGCSLGQGQQVIETTECTKYQYNDSNTYVQCKEKRVVYMCKVATEFWNPDKILAICETKEECNKICQEVK